MSIPGHAAAQGGGRDGRGDQRGTTSRRGVRAAGRQRLLPARLQLPGRDSNAQPTDYRVWSERAGQSVECSLSRTSSYFVLPIISHRFPFFDGDEPGTTRPSGCHWKGQWRGTESGSQQVEFHPRLLSLLSLAVQNRSSAPEALIRLVTRDHGPAHRDRELGEEPPAFASDPGARDQLVAGDPGIDKRESNHFREARQWHEAIPDAAALGHVRRTAANWAEPRGRDDRARSPNARIAEWRIPPEATGLEANDHTRRGRPAWARDGATSWRRLGRTTFSFQDGGTPARALTFPETDRDSLLPRS